MAYPTIPLFSGIANPIPTGMDGYSLYYIPSADSGVDNKYDYVNSLIAQGALYADGTPVSISDQMWGQNVFVPPATSSPASIVTPIDYNPTAPDNDDWISDIIPILGAAAAIYTGGSLLGGALGGSLFGGEATALGAAEGFGGMVGGAIPEGMTAIASPVLSAGAPTLLATEAAGAYTIPGLANALASYTPTTNYLGSAPSTSTSTSSAILPDTTSAAGLNMGGTSTSLVDSIPSLASATTPDLASVGMTGYTPQISQSVIDAATTPYSPSFWDITQDFLKNNATDVGKTAYQMFGEAPQGQTTPNFRLPNMTTMGGQQPTGINSPSQKSQQLAQQLSVPQFTPMESPRQGSSYQMPVYGQQQGQGAFNDPSIFQLSQSTWNPAMANALRSYNG